MVCVSGVWSAIKTASDQESQTMALMTLVMKMGTLKIPSFKSMALSNVTKSYLTVLGTSLIYFAMGLYFAAGNTGVYLTSYLIYRSNSDMKLDDAIWFLSAAGFSALLLPLGGWLEGRLGVRGVCLLGGLLQSCGIFATYFALDTTFLLVVLVYGGSFLVSLASCYTSPLVNVCKWHPNHKGLVTGIGSASMALAPTLFTPLITAIVNPDNLPANGLGLFDDERILDRTKLSTLYQGAITLSLFLIGTLLTFPADSNNKGDRAKVEQQPKQMRAGDKLPAALVSYSTSHQLNNETKSMGTSRVELAETKQQMGQETTTVTIRPGEKSSNSTSSNEQKLNWQEANLTGTNLFEVLEFSLKPKFAFQTLEFWLLSLKVLISELIFIYLLFMYKPYGQTFIQDDYFLSSVGAACAISNTLGRLTMGHVKDKLGFKAVSIPLSATTMLFVTLMPLTRFLNKLFYGLTVVLAVGAVGSQYALVPSAAQDSFGDKYASINIGFVYMSTVVATVSSALLSQNLTSLIGWEGMISLIAACAALDFVATFFMPSNPRRRLIERYRQFHTHQNKCRPDAIVVVPAAC